MVCQCSVYWLPQAVHCINKVLFYFLFVFSSQGWLTDCNGAMLHHLSKMVRLQVADQHFPQIFPASCLGTLHMEPVAYACKLQPARSYAVVKGWGFSTCQCMAKGLWLALVHWPC